MENQELIIFPSLIHLWSCFFILSGTYDHDLPHLNEMVSLVIVVSLFLCITINAKPRNLIQQILFLAFVPLVYTFPNFWFSFMFVHGDKMKLYQVSCLFWLIPDSMNGPFHCFFTKTSFVTLFLWWLYEKLIEKNLWNFYGTEKNKTLISYKTNLEFCR